MFIAIANIDLEFIMDNCNMERYNDYNYETEHPVFLVETFEQVRECFNRYYYSLDGNYDYCPDYTIYEINRGLWSVKGSHTINIKIDRHDV